MAYRSGILLRLTLILILQGCGPGSALALPPPEEIPEEILRAEADLAARSPLDNRPLSPSEYEQLRTLQHNRRRDPEVAPEVEQLIFLLKLRQGLRSILPF